MNAKTMEGLAGASASMSLISTPMNVAKEAERKGDTDKMQRALGYAAGMKDQAEEYGKKAEKGMKADAEEAKKQEKLHQEELIEARRKEREEQEKRLKGEGAGSEASSFDSVEISPEGKSQVGAAEETAPDGFDTAGAAAIGDGTGDMVYDKSGESAQSAAAEGAYVDVSV